MKPHDRVKAQGYGALRKCARAIGFHEEHVRQVISMRRPPSLFFIKCLNDYLGTQYQESDFMQGQITG